MPTQNQLDQDAVNLAKAIRETETRGQADPYNARGKSREFGAYQYTPETWKADTAKFLGRDVPLEQADKVTQNEVAYKKIKSLKDQGYNVGQIASIWNSGQPEWEGKRGVNKFGVRYDVPQYVDSVANAYQQIKRGSSNPTIKPNASTVGVDSPQAARITGNEAPLEAGLNAIKNTPKSAIDFGMGVLSSFNPLNILDNAAQIPQAFGELSKEKGGILPAIGATLEEIPGALYEGLVPRGIRSAISGDIQGASKAFQEDPFGQAAPVVLAAAGGAKALDRSVSKGMMRDYVNNISTNAPARIPIPKPSTVASDAFGKAVETIASPVTKPVGFVANKVGNFAKSVGSSASSHILGLEPSTIREIISDPKQFSKLKQETISRGGLATEVRNAINTRLDDLSEVGKGYESIRNSNQITTVEPAWVTKVLEEQGLKVKKGKVVSDSNSVTRNPADIKAVQKFYKDWGNKKQLTPNEYLNMRSDLAELSKFDKLTGMGKTRASESIGKALYDRANRTIRDTQIQELQALDEGYAPEVKFLKQVKKDYFNKDGTFKDNAPSRIANAANKGELLKRLENVMPGITKRIEILKAAEDIQRASGIKVGTYGRILAGGAGFATAGIPGLLMMEILTSPATAVPLLRSMGYIGAKAAPIIEALRVIGGDIDNLAAIGTIGQGVEKQGYTGLQPRSRILSNTQ